MKKIVVDKFIQSIFYILITLTMISSTLTSLLIPGAAKYRNMLLILIILVSMFICIILKKNINIRHNLILVLWIIFSCSILISIAINNGQFFLGIATLFIVPIIYFILIPNILGRNTINVFLNSFIFSNLFISLYCIVSKPIIYPYQGIFSNPNSMGLVGLFLAIGMSIKLDYFLEENNKFKVISGIILLLFPIGIIILTGSRTSLLVSIISILYIVIPKKIDSTEFIKRVKVMFIFMSVSIIFLVKNPKILEGIVNKIKNSSSLLSGRDYIWLTTINQSKLYGHGQSYFIDNFRLGPHNSTIDILGSFGIISCVLYILVCITVFYKITKYIKKNTSSDSIFLSVINMTFLITSLTEGIYSPLGNSLVMCWLCCIGYIYYLEKVEV